MVLPQHRMINRLRLFRTVHRTLTRLTRKVSVTTMVSSRTVSSSSDFRECSLVEWEHLVGLLSTSTGSSSVAITTLKDGRSTLDCFHWLYSCCSSYPLSYRLLPRTHHTTITPITSSQQRRVQDLPVGKIINHNLQAVANKEETTSKINQL